MSKVADGQVSKVTIAGNEVRGRDVKGIGFHVVAPPNQGPMLETLQKRGVEIWFRKEAAQDWPTWVMNLAPLIMLAALWFFMIRQMQLRSKRSTSGQPTSTDPQMNPRFGP